MPYPMLLVRRRAGEGPRGSLRSWPHRLAAGAGALTFLTLAACTTSDDITCPNLPTATDVHLDGSDSRRSEATRAEQLKIIRTEAEHIALCGHGYLRVQLFTSSTAATTTLFEGRVEAEGATQPARRRRVDEAVDPVMEEITADWDAVDADLPGDGTDVLGQLELMAEYFTQHPEHHHRGVLHTDGLQTTGRIITNDAAFTEEAAADLATRVSVPDLTGVELTIAGIGRVAGEPPPSSYVTALKRFYGDVCERTGAECLVVTDLAAD